jgi:hypothetical protein
MVRIPISVGELIDKLSILQVKKTKITNQEKLNHILKEFETLYNIASNFLIDEKIFNLYHELVFTNSSLWEVEDLLRIQESQKTFDDEFVKLARKVYHLNDERYRVKTEINILTSSDIIEIKEYVEY